MHNLAHIISGSSKHLTNEITYHKEKTASGNPQKGSYLKVLLVVILVLAIAGIGAITFTNNNLMKNISEQPAVKIDDGQESSDAGQLDEQYILPHSSTEYLNESDVKGFTYDELQLARNEIFARHGYKFEQEPFKSYFNNQTWYQASSQYNYESLNTIEKQNIEFILFQEDHYVYEFDVDDEDYVFPYSDCVYLTDEDVKGLSLEVIKLGRNEIFARHGYVFKMQVFDEYFSQKSWYEKRENFSSDDLNKFESYNVTFLKEEEVRR
jgi:hypothetical protein